MTQEEAKTKRCCGPEGCGALDIRTERLREAEAAASGRIEERGSDYGITVHRTVSGRMCIGSPCMAWRWQREPEGHFSHEGELYTTRGSGHCGLAGEP